MGLVEQIVLLQLFEYGLGDVSRVTIRIISVYKHATEMCSALVANLSE